MFSFSAPYNRAASQQFSASPRGGRLPGGPGVDLSLVEISQACWYSAHASTSVHPAPNARRSVEPFVGIAHVKMA